MSSPTRTYRGRTVDELIPLIHAELGADAIIVRRREGLTGGLLGFFQHPYVEIEAMAGAPRVDLYDEQQATVPPAGAGGGFDGHYALGSLASQASGAAAGEALPPLTQHAPAPPPPPAPPPGQYPQYVQQPQSQPAFAAAVQQQPAAMQRPAAQQPAAAAQPLAPAAQYAPAMTGQGIAFAPQAERRPAQARIFARDRDAQLSGASGYLSDHLAALARAGPEPAPEPVRAERERFAGVAAAEFQELIPPTQPFSVELTRQRPRAPEAHAITQIPPAAPAAPAAPAVPLPVRAAPPQPYAQPAPAQPYAQPPRTPDYAQPQPPRTPDYVQPQPVQPAPEYAPAQPLPPAEVPGAYEYEQAQLRITDSPAVEYLPPPPSPPTPQPLLPPAPERRTVPAGSHARARAGVEKSLRRLGVSDALADELIDAAIAHTLPLAPRLGLAQAVRTTLAQRIPVARPLPTRGAAMALVGAGGAGKTTFCAALVAAYRTGSSLQTSFATVTRAGDGGELELILAPQIMKPTPAGSPRAVRALRKARTDGLAVIDTPRLTPSDRAAVREVAKLLAELELDRIVVALPATLGPTAAEQLLAALAPLGAGALAMTHADETDQIGVAVEAACRFDLAPEFVLEHGPAGGWRLTRIDPATLAARLLP